MAWESFYIRFVWSSVFISIALPCLQVNVDRCPTTDEDWKNASSAKKCTSLGCGPNSAYHCVVNENKTLVEVCADPIYLQGVCPFYDTVGQVLQMGKVTCNVSQAQNCSNRYYSTSVYKYPVCIPSQTAAISGKQAKEIPHSISLIMFAVCIGSFISRSRL